MLLLLGQYHLYHTEEYKNYSVHLARKLYSDKYTSDWLNFKLWSEYTEMLNQNFLEQFQSPLQ